MGRKPLAPDEKQRRLRQRMLEKAAEYTTSTYSRKFVSPLFQKMIRAEYALVEVQPSIVGEKLVWHHTNPGQCVCVTCGKADYWDSGLGGMHTGHFLASRRNSILFEEDNVAPQCSRCNRYLSGSPQEFRKWMIAIRGIEVVERLERLKTESISFSREELVDMRIKYAARLKAAEERMRIKP